MLMLIVILGSVPIFFHIIPKIFMGFAMKLVKISHENTREAKEIKSKFVGVTQASMLFVWFLLWFSTDGLDGASIFLRFLTLLFIGCTTYLVAIFIRKVWFEYKVFSLISLFLGIIIGEILFFLFHYFY